MVKRIARNIAINKIASFHFFMMIVWIVLAIPSILWWNKSILWVIFVSLYANFATEFGAWSSARADEAAHNNIHSESGHDETI